MVETVDLGFKMKPDLNGDSIDFEISGSGIGGGAWFGLIFFGAFIGIPITILFNMEAKTVDPIILTWLCIVGIFVGIAYLMNSSRSQVYRFNISPKTVLANGKEYSKDNISEILIRNNSGQTATNVSVDGGTVVFGTGITGVAFTGAALARNAAKKIGASTGQAIGESLAKNGNAVCIRHGRQVIPLAQYLREDDAMALFRKVAEAM